MRANNALRIQSLVTCFVCNAILVGGLWYMSREVLQVLRRWTTLLAAGANALPDETRGALENLDGFILQVQQHLAFVALGFGAAITFMLWFMIQSQGRRHMERVRLEAADRADVLAEGGAEETPAAAAVAPELEYSRSSPGAAVQMLAILQRQGRLIDFLQEDLSGFDDAQVGAAVRSIHQNCREALAEYVQLKPVLDQNEGEEVTVPVGFDAGAIRLTGSVAGDPPFRGALRHQGWRVEKITLPKPTSQELEQMIVAPAEVEVDQ